jgi:putative transposase
VFTVVPKGKVKEVATMLKAIHAQEDEVAEKREGMKLGRVASILREGIGETLSYYRFPPGALETDQN